MTSKQEVASLNEANPLAGSLDSNVNAKSNFVTLTLGIGTRDTPVCSGIHYCQILSKSVKWLSSY